MRINCFDLERISSCVEMVSACDIVRNGDLRISTPFKYPNGDSIDVFLYPKKENLLGELYLSDRGHTYIYLKGAYAGWPETTRKQEIIVDIASQLNVRVGAGEIFLSLSEDTLDELSEGILRVAQACVRISDFATHQRLRSASPFRDDVEDFFAAQSLGFSKDVKVRGSFGNHLRMDFEVTSPKTRSYVNILAAMNRPAAHSAATDIFSKLYDLNRTSQLDHQLVTVFNSQSRAIRESDIQRLRDMSLVFAYPEQGQALAETLSGAAA